MQAGRYDQTMIIIPITAVRRSGSRQTIEATLRSKRAISPEQAVSLGPLELGDFAGLDEAIGLGRVVRMPSGKLFLNPKAVAVGAGEGAGSALALILLAAGSVAASIAALVAFATR